MKSIRLPVLVASILAIGVLAGTALSQATYQPAKIGFVDVAKVFAPGGTAKEIEQEARDQIRAVDVELRKRAEQVRAMQDELDLLQPGTQEFDDKKREIDFEAFKLEYEEKARKSKIVEDAAKRMNGVYTLMGNETANYARRNGLDAVFMVNAKPIEARNLEQLQLLVATRPVIYWNASYDISDPIIEAMNK